MNRTDDTSVEDDTVGEDHDRDKTCVAIVDERDPGAHLLAPAAEDAALPSYGSRSTDFRAELGFWKWFSERENEIFESGDQNEELFEEITERLGQVHECLGFEMTFDSDEFGRREFIISTGGVIEAYGAVKRLIAMVPAHLNRWEFISFRPRRDVGGFLRVDDKYLEINMVRVSIHPLGAYVGVNMFFPSFTGDDYATYVEAAHLILDITLGELDVLANVGPVDVFQLEEGAMNDLLSIDELPGAFDCLCRTLAEHYQLMHCSEHRDSEALIRAAVTLHRATFESLEDVVQEADCCVSEFSDVEQRRFELSLIMRFFSPSDFEVSCLVSHLEPFVRIVELSSCEAPSLRGIGMVTTLECVFDPGTDGMVSEFLSRVIEVAVGCSSDVDVIHFDYDDVFSVIVKSIRDSVHVFIQSGDRIRALQLLEEIEDDYLDDPEFWALFTFTSALNGQLENVEKGLHQIRFASCDQDFSAISSQSIWLIVSACALAAKRDEVGKFLGILEKNCDIGEGWSYVCEVLGDGSELNTIRNTSEIQNFLGHLGALH
jgi:hypothetical protein